MVRTIGVTAENSDLRDILTRSGDVSPCTACTNDNSACVAQLVEQLICNQQVAGSSPIAGF